MGYHKDLNRIGGLSGIARESCFLVSDLKFIGGKGIRHFGPLLIAESERDPISTRGQVFGGSEDEVFDLLSLGQ